TSKFQFLKEVQSLQLQGFVKLTRMFRNIRDQLNAEAEVVQIILTRIDNDIYSTVDACPNACEMWKAIERMVNHWNRNQSSSECLVLASITTRMVKHEVNAIRAERIARVANPLAFVAQQQPVYHPQTYHTQYTQNSSTRTQQAATRNRGKEIVNYPQPIYDQEPSMVAEDDETSKDNEINKLMALISLSFKKIYKPTNNNLRTSSNTSRANQDNSPRINRSAGEFGHVARERQKPKQVKDAAYHREKMLFAHPEQSEYVLDTYPIEQDAHNVIIDSLDMSY
nr:hypothetical protein [Tanacetum cinerariifolium]